MNPKWLVPLGAVMLIAATGDGPRVTEFLRDMVSVYDKDGNFHGREPKWFVPKGGIPVVGPARPGYVGIEHGGQLVYLRMAEVQTEGMQGPCLQVSQSGGAQERSHFAAGGGIGAGVGSGRQVCVAESK